MFKLKTTVKFDALLFISMLTSCIIGLLMIFSYVWRNLFSGSTVFVWKQLIAFCLGLGGIFFIIKIDFRHLRKYAYIIYGFFLGLLVMVLLMGNVVRGSRSWFSLGYFSFQPSEFMPLGLIIVLAKYIEIQKEWRSSKQLFICLLYTLLPMSLILLQPDFGTSLVFIFIFFGMVYLGGAQLRYIVSLLLAGGIAVFISLFSTFVQLNMKSGGDNKFGLSVIKIFGNFNRTLIILIIFYSVLIITYLLIKKIFKNFSFKNIGFIFFPIALGILLSFGIQHFLKDYQRERLIVFLNPNIDPLGTGYNIIQSEIAIGSGKLLGKGILSGTQSQLGFLPEQHTDFIFSVIGEELGFIGAGLILGLLFIIVWRGISIINQARDKFSSLLATGIVCMFVFHTILNIGMVMGIMPVVGVPLPLVSYGGSSLITHMLAVGILLGIHSQRFIY